MGLGPHADGSLTLSRWGVLLSVLVVTLLALLLVSPVNRPGRLPSSTDDWFLLGAYLLPVLLLPVVLAVARPAVRGLSWGAVLGHAIAGLFVGWLVGHAALVAAGLVPFRLF